MALKEEFEYEGVRLFRHRGWLPVVLLAAGLAVYLLTARSAAVSAVCWRCYEYVCLAVSLCGLSVRIFTVGYTPTGTSGRNTARQVAESLNTTGLYSVVRHPLYLGNFLMYLGIAMLTRSVWFMVVFVLVFWIYYERIMFAEEQFLRCKFGGEWLVWASVTPAFVPRLSGFVPPALPFSWKKVLKKEKNGVFALFLIFCLFDTAGAVALRVHDVNVLLAGMAAVSGMVYAVLKYVKKRTSLLDEEGR